MLIFKNFKVFYKDRLNFWLLNLAALSIIVSWLLFLFRSINKSQLTVLHYNIYFGFDIVGNWQWLYIIPGISLALSIINLGLAFYLWNKQQFWSQFFLTVTFLINVMVFIFLYNIINYNL